MISCRRARDILVEHLRGQVGEPTLLQLDQHLADCTACRAERARWSAVGELRSWTPPTLSGRSQERIVARLRQAARQPAREDQTSGRPQARLSAWALAGSLTAATLGAGLAWRLRAHDTARAQATIATAPAQRTPAAPAQKRSATAAMPDTTVVRVTQEQVSRFGGAELRIAGGSDVELRPAAREIALGAGALELSAPVAVEPLHVRGPQFEMVLSRAHARFASDAVRVLDGAVEVYALDGQRLATVGAGGQWPAPVVAPTTAALASPSRPHVAAVAAGSATQATLDRARSRLADGDAEGARSLIRHALAGRPTTAERAQAQIFVAESYLVEGDSDRALAAYAEVARAFPRAAEGEAAAFAAAQLYRERGRHADAEAALRGYLDRYPDGQFAREARDRLAELRTPAQ